MSILCRNPSLEEDDMEEDEEDVNLEADEELLYPDPEESETNKYNSTR